MSSISVIILTYNEAQALKQTVDGIIQTLKAVGCPYEVLIVNDGSTDGTDKIADALAMENPHIRVIHHAVNKGLGEVYRTGFAAAGCDYVTFFPADGQAPPLIIQQFYALMENADMVLGYIPDRADSPAAKVLSRMERLLYTALFGELPKFQGIMMFRREILDAVRLKSSGRAWTVVMELIIRVHKSGQYRIVSAPTHLIPRQSGGSKVVNWRAIRDNFAQAILLRWRY